MKKKIKRFLILFLLVVVGFSISIYTFHFIEVGDYNYSGEKSIYIHDNGMHIDIIIPNDDGYTAYGWGSKIFFMEVPTWDDLTYDIGFQALFTKPAACMRVIEYKQYQPDWKLIRLSQDQLDIINQKIADQFQYDSFGNKIHIKDNFYEANGSYWALKTCNTWANNIIKSAGLRSKLFILNSESFSELY